MKPTPKPQPASKTFRVDLGINLFAAPVPQTNPNMRIFPLQNALIDVTEGEDRAQPAWYAHLGIGDTISFRLVDISNRRQIEEPTYPEVAVAEFYFNNPVTGQPANPFTERVVDWRFSELLDPCTSPAYCLDESVMLPAWNLIPYGADGRQIKTLQFDNFMKSQDDEKPEPFRAFELTVALKLARDGWVNHYVFDPEMIVSDTDSEGPGGGDF